MTDRTTAAAREAHAGEAKLDAINRAADLEQRRARAILAASWVTLVALSLTLAVFVGYVLGRASLP